MNTNVVHHFDWITITQEHIDLFAKVTRDPDPMHIDPKWSAEKGPFPTTVAFGFLTLSLITHMCHKAGMGNDSESRQSDDDEALVAG